jgi:prophage antirepressor-like protein
MTNTVKAVDLFAYDMNTKEMIVNGTSITVVGTCDEPWFSGKELCSSLGYKDVKKALQNNVEDCNKKSLNELQNIYDLLNHCHWGN